MQDLLAGNQPKIEGSTMTNETTASQPKSIGDDAQFLQLLTAVETAPRYSKELSEASAALIIAIDSKLRAPAAHASATIQAAPEELFAAHYYDPLHLVKHLHANIGWSGAVGNFIPVDDYLCQRFIACIKSADAATIQEPVMVAEPVGEVQANAAMKLLRELRQLDEQCEIAPVSELYGDFMLFAERVTKFLDAARMVADPAGVAKIKRTIIGLRDGWGTRADADAAIALLDAATVKAVPSEALTMEQVLDFLHPDFVTEYAAKMLRNGDMVSFNLFQLANIANRVRAPLADKTGASGEKA